ncbi:type II secretion system F family protein [Pseudidiomarina salilacus]|uniref:type II secretion system F family protein n=1 Tax=Pseudidiomarina salilacus TaxID=3384452 RepID=UPI0039846E29
MTFDNYLVVLTAFALLVGAWWLRHLLPWLAAPANRAAQWLCQHLPARMQRALYEWGRSPWLQQTPSELLVGGFGYLCFYLIVLALPLPPLWGVGLATLPVLRYVRLRQLHKRDIRRVVSNWPAVLDLLAMLLQAGLSWRAALHAISEIKTRSLALRQLQIMQQQLNVGITTLVSLEELAQRIPAAEIKVFVAAVAQSQLTGASLAETLQLQAQRIRTEQQLQAEKQAQEMSIKLLLPLVTCFFPVTFLLILGPIFLGFIVAT